MSTRIRTLIPFAALVAAALFPYGWLAGQLPAVNLFFDRLFPETLSHIIGHAAIFLVLGLALLRVAPGLGARPWAYAAIILALALAQELFQRSYKARLVSPDDLLDLTVDALAAAAAFAIARRGWLARPAPEARRPHDQAAGR